MKTSLYNNQTGEYEEVPEGQEISPFFTAKELACSHCGRVRLAPNYGLRLSYLRLTWGSPLTSNSCCRCPEHNAAVGGVKKSLHLTEEGRETNGCCATDINWADWSATRKETFVLMAVSQGWSVGLHPRFCHIDQRRNLAGLPRATFKYKEWKGYE